MAANKVAIAQAANTGLTGGSTPAGVDYDHDVVIINTLRISKLFVIDQGRQVICLPGTTLYQLGEALEPYGREPHSAIGASCILRLEDNSTEKDRSYNFPTYIYDLGTQPTCDEYSASRIEANKWLACHPRCARSRGEDRMV